MLYVTYSNAGSWGSLGGWSAFLPYPHDHGGRNRPIHAGHQFDEGPGFTEQTFGLCHLLGFKFSPRLRDVSGAKLYSFNKPSDYPRLENTMGVKVNTKITKDNYDDVLKLAHSIREGKYLLLLLQDRYRKRTFKSQSSSYFLFFNFIQSLFFDGFQS